VGRQAGPLAASLRGVTVARRGRVVLREVDVAVRAGQIVQVRGANGAGKTSLLRVLAGVAAPRGGTAVRAGTVAFVPERLALAADLRAGEWLRAVGALRGRPRDAHLELLQDAGLPDAVLARPLGALSQGQLQRVALVDALTGPCALLVLDEPFSGLDGAGRAWLAARVCAHAARGGACVVTDHADTGADGLRLDAELHIAGGRVAEGRPSATSRPLVLVRSRDPGGVACERLVAPDESDGVLRDLLAAGHHIEEVASR